MSSILAWRLANKLCEAVCSNDKPTYSELMIECGYSKTTARLPYRVIRSPYFQRLMSDFINNLKKEVDRLTQEMNSRDLSKEKYETLAVALDKVNKQLQLATGGSTDNQKISIEISGSIAQKNNINATSQNTGQDSN